MALTETLTEAIQAAKDELARVKTSTKADVDRAQAKLDELQALKRDLTPEVEQLVTRLRAAKLDGDK